MQYVTREELEKYIGDRRIIQLEDLTEFIEEQFGVAVKLEKNDKNQKMTDFLSANTELIEKLKNARKDRDSNFSTYLRNKHEFDKFLNEK